MCIIIFKHFIGGGVEWLPWLQVLWEPVVSEQASVTRLLSQVSPGTIQLIFFLCAHAYTCTHLLLSPFSPDTLRRSPLVICSVASLMTLKVPKRLTFITRWNSSRGCGPFLDRVLLAIPIPIIQITYTLLNVAKSYHRYTNGIYKCLHVVFIYNMVGTTN